MDKTVGQEDLAYCINAASQYSPWASASVRKGYITAQGGHRIGICGEAAIVDSKISTITTVTSLCIRVARDYPGIALKAVGLNGSIVVIGSPGTGKTTLLRDLARQKSNLGCGAVAVVDERCELFPMDGSHFCFPVGKGTDVLTGVQKVSGMDMMIRTMNPRWLVLDEITAQEDSAALLKAAWCGVSILASAHAENMQDFMERPIYKPLTESRLFSYCLVMGTDKSWSLERMNK